MRFLVPCLPAALSSLALFLGNAADTIADSARHSDEVADVLRGSDNVDDVLDAAGDAQRNLSSQADNLSNSADALSKANAELHIIQNGCFPAGTPVLTYEGLKAIEHVQQGERVWAFDVQTGEWQLRPVLDTIVRDFVGRMVTITIAGEQIQTTDNHPVYVVEGHDLANRPSPEHVPAMPENSAIPGRWVDAIDLRIGDVMLLKPDKRAAITNLQSEPAAITVYNFEVEELHCYAVGLNHILVHNNAASYWDTLSLAEKAAPLAKNVKTALHAEATFIMSKRFDSLVGTLGENGIVVHHTIPLEWAHLFPGVSPNSGGRIAAMFVDDHTRVTKAWNAWKGSLGREPTAIDVIQQAHVIRREFGHLFSYGKGLSELL